MPKHKYCWNPSPIYAMQKYATCTQLGQIDVFGVANLHSSPHEGICGDCQYEINIGKTWFNNLQNTYNI